jgi:hypothetical protein
MQMSMKNLILMAILFIMLLAVGEFSLASSGDPSIRLAWHLRLKSLNIVRAELLMHAGWRRSKTKRQESKSRHFGVMAKSCFQFCEKVRRSWRQRITACFKMEKISRNTQGASCTTETLKIYSYAVV